MSNPYMDAMAEAIQTFDGGEVEPATKADPTLLAPSSDPVIDENSYFNMNDPMARQFVERVKKTDDDRRARLAGPGELGLPDLLDRRRLEFLIPDEAFREQPLYDRIFIYQISMWKTDKYGDGLIEMPEIVKDAEKFSNPRGVLIAAGPIALDEIRSNGADLGHVVTFIKLAPWRLQVAAHRGRDEHILIMRSCDLIASEDLARQLREGALAIAPFKVERDGRAFTTHVIREELYTESTAVPVRHPMQPSIPEDY